MFMNEYDLEVARSRFIRSSTPNRLGLVFVVDALREWANENSDGWAYWVKPRNAASKAIALIESTTNAENWRQEQNDITPAEAALAVRPIRAFLTRHKVSPERKEIILRGVTAWD